MKTVYKRIIYLVFALASTMLIIQFCKSFKKPAPAGFDGIYALPGPQIYTTDGISKDSLLTFFQSNNFEVIEDSTNFYNTQWDSMQYKIGKINCGADTITAYIRFKILRLDSTTIDVYLIEGLPTKDDSLYYKRAKDYFDCIESLLKKNNLVK